jgi:hypothetical protein
MLDYLLTEGLPNDKYGSFFLAKLPVLALLLILISHLAPFIERLYIDFVVQCSSV